MIKIRAFDEVTNQIITEESSGLTSSQILSKYSICMLYANMVEHECLCADPDNEVQIYEGDIVEAMVWKNGLSNPKDYETYIDEIVLNWGAFRLKESRITLNQLDTIKIIGNVHQNKQLIKCIENLSVQINMGTKLKNGQNL